MATRKTPKPGKRAPTKTTRGSSKAEHRTHRPEVARSTRAPAPLQIDTSPQAEAAFRAREAAQRPQPTPWDLFRDAPDAMAQFCDYLLEESGRHMAGFCKERGFRYSTMLSWVNSDPTRIEMYARAREDRADLMAQEIAAISDEKDVRVVVQGEEERLQLDAAAVARNRLRVDARKWLAAKLKPKVYGDKLELNDTRDVRTLPDTTLVKELAALGISVTIGPKPLEESRDG